MKTTKRRVTLKTIADECGYSINTVSRALRNDTRLPAETISKIQNAANELGYIRNSLASSLRSGKSNIIAVIVEEIQNQHYAVLISQLDLRLREYGYHVMILCAQFEKDANTNVLDVAISHFVDGILFFPYTVSRHIAEVINKSNIPLVLIDREITGVPTDIVRCDDFQGGYLAGKEFLKLGHRRFLYLAGPLNNGAQPKRQGGFLRALEEEGLTTKDMRIISSVDMLRCIRENTVKDFIFPVDYTAIFSFNDQMAYYVSNCLREEGYRIPEDVSIIGFDYIRQSIPYLMPLSSISCQKGESVAEKAVQLLLSRIADPSLPPRTEILPITIYDEGTVAAANS